MPQPPNYPNYEGWQQRPQQTNTQYPQQWQPPQYPAPPNTYYPPQQWQQPPPPPRPQRKRQIPGSFWGLSLVLLSSLPLLAMLQRKVRIHKALQQQSQRTPLLSPLTHLYQAPHPISPFRPIHLP